MAFAPSSTAQPHSRAVTANTSNTSRYVHHGSQSGHIAIRSKVASYGSQPSRAWCCRYLSRSIYRFDSGRLSAREFIIGAILEDRVSVRGPFPGLLVVYTGSKLWACITQSPILGWVPIAFLAGIHEDGDSGIATIHPARDLACWRSSYMAQSRALNHMISRGCTGSSAFESVVSRFESDTLGTMIIFNTSNGTDLVEYPFATHL